MSADLLRRAAKAMREQAEAATPGPWVVDLPDIHRAEHPGEWVADAGDGSRCVVNSEHIASWHPAVALAVADWLDYEAGEIGPVKTPDGRQVTYIHGNPYAFTVARAYLGEIS